MTVYIGIDPGWAKGAIAVIDERGAVRDLMAVSKHSWHDLASALAAWSAHGAVAAIERVSAMPGQGVSSTFKFGRGYGIAEGLLIGLGIQYEEVLPTAWQAGLGIDRGLKGQDRKRALKAVAQQRWPDLGITMETADAPLIAAWARASGMWGQP
jgi:hypothetical protein